MNNIKINKILTFLKIPAESVHGLGHWRQVEKIGHYLAERNGADKKVISAFAFIHDVGKLKQGVEPEHGKRSAEIISQNFDTHFFDLNERQYEQLLEAVSLHNKADAQSLDLTVQTCWDADRLDLPRVGITPDRKLLYTEVGKSAETFKHLGITD